MKIKKRVIVYVDGYNFYYGLRNGGPKWKQKSFALASKCDHVVWLGHYRARFVQSMLPDSVMLGNGYVAHRPENWK